MEWPITLSSSWSFTIQICHSIGCGSRLSFCPCLIILRQLLLAFHNLSVLSLLVKPENFLLSVVAAKNGNLCKGDTINITCSAVGKPVVHAYQVFEDDNLVHTSNNPEIFFSHTTRTSGVVVFTCVANNSVATANTTRAISASGKECFYNAAIGQLIRFTGLLFFSEL